MHGTYIKILIFIWNIFQCNYYFRKPKPQSSHDLLHIYSNFKFRIAAVILILG